MSGRLIKPTPKFQIKREMPGIEQRTRSRREHQLNN